MRELKAARVTIPPVSELDHSLGPAAAPVTLVEYGDYECLYCAEAYMIVKDIKRWLGNELRFVFRNFPITNSHPNAQLAAEAAEAAGAQGRFWEMHDYLFKHQKALDYDHIPRYAQILGLDMTRFNREITEHKYEARVREDFVNGFKGGVSGTPTFFINGVRYDDSWDLGTLLEAVELAGITSYVRRNYARYGT
jgi:protein-disulfide isomerase